MEEGQSRNKNQKLYLTVKELAARYSVHINTIYLWNRTGKGPRYIKFGKALRYPIDEIEHWEARRLVTPELAQGG